VSHTSRPRNRQAPQFCRYRTIIYIAYQLMSITCRFSLACHSQMCTLLAVFYVTVFNKHSDRCTYQLIVHFSSSNLTDKFVIGSVCRPQPCSGMCFGIPIQESSQPIRNALGLSAMIVSFAMHCDAT